MTLPGDKIMFGKPTADIDGEPVQNPAYYMFSMGGVALGSVYSLRCKISDF